MKSYLIYNGKITTQKLCSDNIYYEALYDLVSKDLTKSKFFVYFLTRRIKELSKLSKKFLKVPTQSVEELKKY